MHAYNSACRSIQAVPQPVPQTISLRQVKTKSFPESGNAEVHLPGEPAPKVVGASTDSFVSRNSTDRYLREGGIEQLGRQL